MNDLTQMLVFTSGRKILTDPEFLSGELWIDTSARRRLRQEASDFKEPIPWRRDRKKEEVHLATVIDDNAKLEEIEKKSKCVEKTYFHNYNISISPLNITNSNSTSYMYHEHTSSSITWSYTNYRDDDTWRVYSIDNGSGIITYSIILQKKDLANKVIEPIYLLPIGHAEEIREAKKDNLEIQGKVCTNCGKRITKFPSKFLSEPDTGMCMSCMLLLEKQHRKLPVDEEFMYDGDRYPKGWKRKEKDETIFDRYKNPWWLEL